MRRAPAPPAPPSLLQVATEVLVADPGASLADVARAAGIGRTTLHKLYPTRHDLLVALARDGLDVLESVYAAAGLDVDGTQVVAALDRLVTALVPLGPRLEYLLRERSLDAEPDLVQRLAILDEQVRALVRRGQAAGGLTRELGDDWIVASMNALVYSAWEQVALGRLAPVSAAPAVMRTLVGGLGNRDT